MGTVFGNALFHFSTATRATWFAADLFDVSNVAGAIFGSVFEAQFTDLPAWWGEDYKRRRQALPPALSMFAMVICRLEFAFAFETFAFFAVFAHEFARERIVALDREDFAA